VDRVVSFTFRVVGITPYAYIFLIYFEEEIDRIERKRNNRRSSHCRIRKR